MFGYNDEHLAQDIAADDRLLLFVTEHHVEQVVTEEPAVVNADQEAVVPEREYAVEPIAPIGPARPQLRLVE